MLSHWWLLMHQYENIFLLLNQAPASEYRIEIENKTWIMSMSLMNDILYYNENENAENIRQQQDSASVSLAENQCIRFAILVSWDI